MTTIAAYSGNAFAVSGSNILISPLAAVAVRREDTGALASLFSDRAGAVGLSNPMTADSFGRFTFFAEHLADGYRITVTEAASPGLEYTLRYQQCNATLSQIPASARSSNTILSATDSGKAIIATGTFTQTFSAAATLADGWWCEYRNDGTGIITLDPNGAETIDGATTIKLYTGESCRIVGDGVGLKTFGRSTGRVLIQRQVAASSAQIDFTVGIGSDFDEYEFVLNEIAPATNTANLLCRASEDGGATFKAGATDYAYQQSIVTDAGSPAGNGSTGDTSLALANNQSSSTSLTLSGRLRLYAPSSTAHIKWFIWDMAYTPSGSTIRTLTASGCFKLDNNAVNAIRFLMSSGNIASGSFALYGVRKS